MSIVSLRTQKAKKKQGRRRGKGNTVLSWLRERISGIDLGKEIDDADGTHPVHLNANAQILEYFARLQNGERSWLRCQWDWAKLKYHGYDEATYYFAGAAERSKPTTLFLIDVDCKRRGSPEGARAFLLYLRTDECLHKYGVHFPRLFTESSTHGRGGHGFPIIDKQGHGPALVNDLLLHRLQPLLNHIAKEEGHDIEFVEVKGTLPEVQWGEKKYEVLSYKAGCLAKLPREAEARFDELKATTVITTAQLLRLDLHNGRTASTTKATSAEPEGSISGKHFTDEMLGELQEGGRYQVVAEELLGAHQLATSGRQVVTADDVGIFMMLGEWFTGNMPENGAMPTSRWRGMWSALFECGDVERAWCHKRYKAIRDWLSSLGLLAWANEEFVMGWWDESGKYHKGKAAKWRFSGELMGMLAGLVENQDLREREDEDVVGAGPGATSNNKRERKHPLWEQQVRKWAFSLTRLPKEKTMRPVPRTSVPVYLWNPDEITRFVEPFVALAA